ncbi:MAG TPA: tetratricopeptide repeat protein [Sphingobium sp.]|nr:tetratricopeptide repeat protein [Sphingobium sp.]
MMRRIVGLALIFASGACSSGNRDVAIRPVNADAVAMATAKEALARGQLLFSRGEHALALEAFRRAMRQEPSDANALNGVAISYAAMGRHDLARQYFELALARAPLDERVHRNFARSLMAQGLRDDANALLAEIGQGAEPVGARRVTLAQLAVGAGKPALPVQTGGLELERVSMGEVRLRTMAADSVHPVLQGRRTARLNTVIVRVADMVGASPAMSLSRELKAQIVESAAVASVPACGGGRCPAMGGGDEPDRLFEKLWQWSGGRG